MENSFHNYTGRAATVGGILTILFFKVHIEDLFTTALLAAIGTTVSFGVSTFLGYLLRRFRHK